MTGSAAAEPGRKVTLGIRPEHLVLGDHGIPAEVVVVEPTGSETHVLARTGARDVVAVFRERHAFHPGDGLHLAPMAGMVHLFDAESGDRIGE